MAKYASFRELIVWQKGMDLAEGIHRATQGLPTIELWTLVAQLRRAANSIPSTVAEGFSRRSGRAYRSHVAMALGSQAEVQTQLELSGRLGLIERELVEQLQELAAEVGRLLNGLWRALTASAVCYSVGLIAAGLGLAPWAWGLIVHGFSVLS
jgi:four helix bundle protein